MRLMLRLSIIMSIALVSAISGEALNPPTPIINHFGQTGLFYLQSAKTLGMGRLAINAYGNFSNDDQYLKMQDTSLNISEIQRMTLTPNIGYGITNYFDLALNVPIYWDYLADSLAKPLRGGFGDMTVSGKLQYPPYPHDPTWELALYGAVTIPTGTPNEGYFPRRSYYIKNRETNSTQEDTANLIGLFTSTSPELDLKFLTTLDLEKMNAESPIQLHLNFGAHFAFNSDLDNLFLLNIGMEYHPIKALALFTEFSGETRVANVKNGFKLGDDPLRVSPGITFTSPAGVCITIGGDIDLTPDTTYIKYMHGSTLFTTRVDPRWKLAGSIGWNNFVTPQDYDHDGIKDNVDRCPKDPEDFDGYEDNDGCPEVDNDNDGIPDLKDKCANDPEDKDGFMDDDGCPEVDNDKDGILDLKDQCPNVAEDLDGFEDENGCPDYDNDNDGLADSVDKCMNSPEDRDGFRDDDGCPEFDNDGDGIADSVDNCPDTKGVPENQGCPQPVVERPKPKEIERGSVILRGVNFEFNKSILTDDSYAILEQVFESLKAWPEVKLEIQGHTDNVGSEKKNLELSQNRADAVRTYFIGRGIDPTRLTSKGYGKSIPVADNKSAEGRALNRRVELKRLD